MISWKPIRNKDIRITSAEATKKVQMLQRIGIFYYPILFFLIFLSTKFKGGEGVLTAILFAFLFFIYYLWIKYRKNYISMMEKSGIAGRLFYEDYSWKDSLVMLTIMIFCSLLIFFLLFIFFPK